MVDKVNLGALTWFHIVSVIGWSVVPLAFLVSIAPELPRLSTQANGELIFKRFPRFFWSLQMFTVFALVFGPLIALAINDDPPNALDFVSPWSRLITIGAFIGIATFFVVSLVLAPTAKKFSRLIQQIQQNPQQPPSAELHVLQKRMAIGAPLSVLILLLPKYSWWRLHNSRLASSNSLHSRIKTQCKRKKK